MFLPFIAFASTVALALPATALEVSGVRFDDVLRIWLGDAPTQANMHPALIGEKG